MSINAGDSNQPIYQSELHRSIVRDVADYFKNIIDTYPPASSFRLTVYLLEGVLIGCFSYLWLEYTHTTVLFRTLYPILLAVTIIFWHYLVTEFGGRRFYKRRENINLTVAKFYLISFTGICVGYFMVYFNSQCPGIADYYPDIASFYSGHSSPTIVRLAVFYKIVLIPWAITTFLLTQSELKRQLAKELVAIKQINASLTQRKLDIFDNTVLTDDGINPLPAEGDLESAAFRVPLKNGHLWIALIDIYFITVEDHYCKFVINRDGEMKAEYVRLSLKEALANLPPSRFVQVHRSYVVNLEHVHHIKKVGQAYQLSIRGINSLIPASRHRAQTFLPKMQAILS